MDRTTRFASLADRARYHRLRDQVARLHQALFIADQAMDRHRLLVRRAELAERITKLADRVSSANRLVIDQQAAAGIAQLLHLVAATEMSVALAEWRYPDELEPGGVVWRHGWTLIDAVSCADTTGHVRVAYAGGTKTLTFVEAELVRVAGEDRFEVVEDARDAGAGFGEALGWQQLATTATHAHRAALLHLLAEPAAARLGQQAARVLIDIADTEDHLAGQYGDDLDEWGEA